MLTHHFYIFAIVVFFSAVLLEIMFIELCTTCSSLHVCIRSCLSCFWDLRFLGELRLFALINSYYECLEHAHQFISVNMAVSSCQVVLFWLLVSGMAIIL